MIQVQDEGALRIVRLNRPDKANALLPQMIEDLIVAFDGARDHDAVIVTGAGRIFCAGADLDAARAGLAKSSIWGDLSAAVARLRGLSIAALNGSAVGGSLGMIMACDVRVCVGGANFFYPVMKHGFAPPAADPGRMRALIGPARTKLMLLGGEKIGAAQAEAWGLVDAIRDDPMAQARQWCRDFLAAPQGHGKQLKAILNA